MKLNLGQIRIDGGTQPRAELLIEVMEDYAEQMKAGVEFPPITVFFDGDAYWLADGFHRVGANKRAFGEDAPIEAEVIQGTQADAQWYSYSVNKTHGLRRNNEDKERAVRSALQHAVQLLRRRKRRARAHHDYARSVQARRPGGTNRPDHRPAGLRGGLQPERHF